MTPTNEPFRRSGRQDLVYRSLAERDARVSDLYEAAARELATGSSSTRFCSAAHLIRLMMVELPKFFELPALTSLPLLTDKVIKLGEAWKGARESKCRTPKGWIGGIDAPLGNLLGGCEAFFAWHEGQPSKEQIAGEALRRSDPAPVAIPQNLVEQRSKRWMKLLKYFNAVAHGSSKGLERFEQNLEEVEGIILGMLLRTPSEGIAVIDAILAEENADA